METALIGIFSSVVAEAITWLNKKLTGSFLQGNGSFIVASVIAIVGAVIKIAISNQDLSWSNLGIVFSQMFTTSQIFFKFVVKQFNLDIKNQ